MPLIAPYALSNNIVIILCSLLPADSNSPLITRMKCRLFSVSLKVSIAMPPMPSWVGSKEVRIALNVSET